MSLSRRQLLVSGAGLAVGSALASFGSENVWGQPAAAPVGLALTIGVNRVGREHYSRVPAVLQSCVNDAKAMAKIAKDAGFRKIIQLHDEQATRFEVSRHIYHAGQRLKPGDLFMVAFSGHGPNGVVGDTPDAEADGKDQGWCLYDWIMVDDELYNLWQQFKSSGVRILVFADSCHSGTSAKTMAYAKALGLDQPPDFDALAKGEMFTPKDAPKGFTKSLGNAMGFPEPTPAVADILYPSKALPPDIVRGTYRKNKAEYDQVLRDLEPHRKSSDEMSASGLLIASSQDSQESRAGYPYSAFTRELLEVWKNSPGSYRDLYMGIHSRLRWHNPNWYPFGVFDPVFHGQRPFTV